MPVHPRGRGCFQWGSHGHVYCGPGAYQKAARQGRAAYSHGYRGRELADDDLSPEALAKLSDADLERLPTDVLDRAAFGFSSEDVFLVPLSELHVIYQTDLENAESDVQTVAQARKVLRNAPPIDVALRGGRFEIEDGHHRYVAARILRHPSILARVTIKDNPILALRRPRKRTGKALLRELRDSNPLAALILATSLRYPPAGDSVDGLYVRPHVPNLDSIDGYFAASKTISGIGVVPMSDLGGPRSVFYAADDFARSEHLADAIRTSGEINPLIIGVDEKGPFIIEGAHRFVALWYLKAREFPAVVVVGEE